MLVANRVVLLPLSIISESCLEVVRDLSEGFPVDLNTLLTVYLREYSTVKDLKVLAEIVVTDCIIDGYVGDTDSLGDILLELFGEIHDSLVLAMRLKARTKLWVLVDVYATYIEIEEF